MFDENTSTLLIIMLPLLVFLYLLTQSINSLVNKVVIFAVGTIIILLVSNLLRKILTGELFDEEDYL